jgi:hypothetical protein
MRPVYSLIVSLTDAPLPPSATIPPAVMQCCQVAEIPAKKFRRGREKKEIWPNVPKSGRKGAKLCIDVFVKLAKLFANWPNFFDVLARTIWGPGNAFVKARGLPRAV